jgi:hypothetical protein
LKWNKHFQIKDIAERERERERFFSGKCGIEKGIVGPHTLHSLVVHFFELQIQNKFLNFDYTFFELG